MAPVPVESLQGFRAHLDPKIVLLGGRFGFIFSWSRAGEIKEKSLAQGVVACYLNIEKRGGFVTVGRGGGVGPGGREGVCKGGSLPSSHKQLHPCILLLNS